MRCWGIAREVDTRARAELRCRARLVQAREGGRVFEGPLLIRREPVLGDTWTTMRPRDRPLHPPSARPQRPESAKSCYQRTSGLRFGEAAIALKLATSD
jgi:hypothetical protein